MNGPWILTYLPVFLITTKVQATSSDMRILVILALQAAQAPLGISTGNPVGIQKSSCTPTCMGTSPVHTGFNLMGLVGTQQVRVHMQVRYVNMLYR
jgi:hypothetical protein